jgi:Zinc carboxypeptidase
VVRALQEGQNVSLASVTGYDDVVQALDRIERTSNGLVTVASAGQSGEGRELLYATVGSGPTTFWLQARIHGNELHSTEAALQILDLLDSDNPTARLIRENLTVVVIPMYNPDGSEANIRQSTTPNRIDFNRDWENFTQPESIAFWKLWRDVAPQLALDLHHMGQAPIVNGTNDLNQFQIGARSIDPARMTELQWLTKRQMAMVSVDALDQYGLANVAHYPIIDITNAALSRMLMGGTNPHWADFKGAASRLLCPYLRLCPRCVTHQPHQPTIVDVISCHEPCHASRDHGGMRRGRRPGGERGGGSAHRIYKVARRGSVLAGWGRRAGCRPPMEPRRSSAAGRSPKPYIRSVPEPR